MTMVGQVGVLGCLHSEKLGRIDYSTFDDGQSHTFKSAWLQTI